MDTSKIHDSIERLCEVRRNVNDPHDMEVLNNAIRILELALPIVPNKMVTYTCPRCHATLYKPVYQYQGLMTVCNCGQHINWD